MTSLGESLRFGKTTAQRVGAAVDMGHEGAKEHAAVLLDTLRETDDAVVASACCVALEMIGATDTAKDLIVWLETCPDAQVWNVAHAVGRLTGIDRAVPRDADVAGLRRCWLQACASRPAPSVNNVVRRNDVLEFAVDSGRSQIRIDFDAPPPGTSNWPRWNRSL